MLRPRAFAPWSVLVLVAGVVTWSWRSTPGARTGPAEVTDEQAAAAAATYDILVDYRDSVSTETLDATPFTEEALSQLSTRDGLYRVRFDDFASASEAMRTLRSHADVESVDWDVPATLPPDETLSALDRPSMDCAAKTAERGFPNDPCFQYQWHLRQIGLPNAWKLNQGDGVVVAVIDTGVTKVPDLAGTPFVPGYNFVANNADASDDHGHGTHVAGTIAQATNNAVGVAGVAFKAKIMPLKVLSASGSGSMGAIAQAIRWAADNGAHVINMSLGGPFPVTTIRSAVKYARSKGVVVVAAAGNDGRGRVSYPAKYPEVVAVAATQFDETTTFYSNWGGDIDIAAPGGNVRVDQNGDGKPDGVLQNTVVPGNIGKTDYLWFMGTSMASPHVAGVAALVVGAGVKGEKAEELLRATARRPKTKAAGSGRVDDRYGAGIVDAGAALKKAKLGTGAGSLALAGALGLVGLAGLRRRGSLAKLGLGAPVALVIGASGLFALPFFVDLPSSMAFLSVGLTETIPATFAGLGRGNPLFFSAALPLAAVGLLAGVSRARPWLVGLSFGIAGALAFAALSGLTDVRYIPDALDTLWLALNATACTLLGRAAALRT